MDISVWSGKQHPYIECSTTVSDIYSTLVSLLPSKLVFFDNNLSFPCYYQWLLQELEHYM